MKKYSLSPSTLNLFLNCQRCFWLDKNKGIKRPRGIYPSLPTGMDSCIKAYFDGYRFRSQFPPEIRTKVTGKLIDLSVLEKWRNWKTTNLYYEDKDINACLSGALDDCIIDNGFYVPLDYKTRGFELTSDPRVYYQTQLDCYCLMLNSSEYKSKNLAYLIYYWPLEVQENGIVQFHVEPIGVKTNSESPKKIIKDAVKLLSLSLPPANPDCEYCNLVKKQSPKQQTFPF